jgi:putative acetyltransferase
VARSISWLVHGPTLGSISLFYGDGYARTSGGKFLVAHAQSLSAGTLAVDVNEQNEAALRFYMMLGFSVGARSPLDAGGRPFPILHMKRAQVDEALSI